MIAEMMADMRAEYERREEALHREIARLTAERDDANARVVALAVALLLPTRPAHVDTECALRLSACGDEVQAMRESMVVVDTGEDVCELEGEDGYDGGE